MVWGSIPVVLCSDDRPRGCAPTTNIKDTVQIEQSKGYTLRDAHDRVTVAHKRRDAYYANSVVSRIHEAQAKVHEKHESSS